MVRSPSSAAGKFNAERPFWFNYHVLVFRATSAETALTITEKAAPPVTEPTDPAGMSVLMMAGIGAVAAAVAFVLAFLLLRRRSAQATGGIGARTKAPTMAESEEEAEAAVVEEE